MSRKIEQGMITAIRVGKNFKSGNTEVSQSALGAAVLLHGNKIAEIDRDGTAVWSLAGWNTPTTRSRINALARAFNWLRSVYCKLGMARVTGPDQTPIHSREWVSAF